jgi:hypothetical protein
MCKRRSLEAVCKKCRGTPVKPKSERFTLERVHGVGTYVCALIHYLDATDFEGRKIIVFQDATEGIIRNTAIDPHFTEKGNIVARFLPGEQCWQNALWLAESRESRPQTA